MDCSGVDSGDSSSCRQRSLERPREHRGQLDTAGNWTPAGVPGGTTSATIVNGGTSSVSSPGAIAQSTTIANGTLSVDTNGIITHAALVVNGGKLQVRGGGKAYTGTHGTVVSITPNVVGSSVGGEAVITGANSLWDTTRPQNFSEASFAVAYGFAAGGLTIESGGRVISDTSMVGTGDGAVGYVTVKGTSSTWTIQKNLTLGDTSGQPNGSYGELLVQESGTVTCSNIALEGSSNSSPTNTSSRIVVSGIKLAAANTYSGGTTVSAGMVLAMNSTGSATGSGQVTVHSGGVLGGTGKIAPLSLNVEADGSIAPGNNGIGTLAVDGNSSIAGNLLIDVAGATSDTLIFTGNLNLNGAAIIVSGSPSPGNTYMIATYTGLLTGVMQVPPGYSLITTETGKIKITFIGQPSNTYSSWASTQFTSAQLAVPLVSGANADPDGDGIVNFLECSFNMPPLSAGNQVLISGTGTVGLPRISRLGSGTSARLSIEYLRRKAPSNSDITYIPQFSSALQDSGPGAWSAATGTETVQSIDTVWERVIVEDTSGTGQPTRFGRVKVTDESAESPYLFSLIPAGSFTMGASLDAAELTTTPAHTLFMSAYYMARNLTTKAEWDTVRAWGSSNGYTDMATGGGKAGNHPVQTVSWWDVIRYCNARSQMEGLTPCYTVSGAVMKTGTHSSDDKLDGQRLPLAH